ncbi:hypothetical protein N7489_004779 [Penicillium chrysogenum]|jgi:hypothetical protein|uniref:Uncharacterized protein n=1 Tax=Penicillium chrysogenum TaxID=5076 RepID=A0ABQ8WDB3_PENCH|nr:uncharacterized protein N7489_004779 [Penicillium chrysogenum]KAJ5244683.1 hypothetical protein N7489_004779 [Penicillium chrysogenum]KAJ5264602.1 hypothetical protein N7505_007395 [Penicillium chrysogenum]KAJ5849382.1 hypothetical protein N7534_008071 [Penicillium rubens]
MDHRIELYSFFSEDRFSCLDYLHDSELDTASRAHICEQVCDILDLFFREQKQARVSKSTLIGEDEDDGKPYVEWDIHVRFKRRK